MSSGNLVSVILVPETVYGEKDTPLSGVVAETARFTSESLSGTPTTTESAAIRTDRMSSGQVVTGLEVGGSLEYELSAGKYFDNMFSAAMMSQFIPPAVIAGTDVTLTPDGADDQLATLTITGDFTTINASPNDVLQLVPASGVTVTVTVISVTSTTELQVATAAGEAAIVSTVMDVEIPAHLVIGAEQQSYTFGKSYLDVQHLLSTDNHSQTYTGTLVNGFTIDATYGNICTGAFEVMGNGYELEAPSYEQQIVAAGGVVNPAETQQPINSSIDIQLLTADGEAATYCTESFQLAFSNGLDPTNCIGSAAPEGYTLGTASIEVNSNIYLSDSAYDLWMINKLSQTPVALTFILNNSAGGWAFALAAVQLSFPDPSSGGQDTQTMIEGSGTGKVGANGESSLIVYKLKGDQ
jgi:hypothetical protein